MSEDHVAATTMNYCIKDEMDYVEDEVTLAKVKMIHDNEQIVHAQMLQFPKDVRPSQPTFSIHNIYVVRKIIKSNFTSNKYLVVSTFHKCNVYFSRDCTEDERA